MKLKFWKKEPEFDFKEPLPATGNDPLAAFGPAPGEQLGLGMDRTAGLGGTSPLDPYQSSTPTEFGQDVIRGKQDYLRELPSAQPRLAQTSLQSSGETVAKDLEIISSKLDAIKAMMESVNQRLEHLERNSRDAYKKW